jgi:hypothetical protein
MLGYAPVASARPGLHASLALSAARAIIRWMLSPRADKLLRLSSGLGLLVLLAAEEKVCPWLVTPPSERAVARGDSAEGTGGDAREVPPDKKRLPSLSLHAVLPEASDLRRLSDPRPRTSTAENQHGRQSLADTELIAAVRPADLDSCDAAFAWRGIDSALRPISIGAPRDSRGAPGACLLVGSICSTGPPAA